MILGFIWDVFWLWVLGHDLFVVCCFEILWFGFVVWVLSHEVPDEYFVSWLKPATKSSSGMTKKYKIHVIKFYVMPDIEFLR
jgi:hypothetical protein